MENLCLKVSVSNSFLFPSVSLQEKIKESSLGESEPGKNDLQISIWVDFTIKYPHPHLLILLYGHKDHLQKCLAFLQIHLLINILAPYSQSE